MNDRPFLFAKGKIGLGISIIFFAAAAIFPQRVVSLAPGMTEIVFALNRGSTLVGVTKFCDYPAAAQDIKKIGGLLDINIEAIVSLAPDIVLIYPEHYDKVKFLRQQTRIVMVRHNRLSDLLQSILEIGRSLRAEKEAWQLVISIQEKMRNISKRVEGRTKVRALFVAGRNADELRNMYVIGNKDFMNDLLKIAGGTNAYRGNVEYPSLSLESVIYLNPEFILEISAHHEGIADEKVFELWRPYAMVAAVAQKQIRIIKDSFWLRPGPRVGQIAEGLADFFAKAGESKINENGSLNDSSQ